MLPSRIQIDTNTYSALGKQDPRTIAVFTKADVIHVSVTVIAELLSGFQVGSREAKNRAQLDQFLAQPGIEILYPNFRTAEIYASINANLTKRGLPIPTNDIWIAAFAIQHDEPLFTFDAHFSRVEGLRFGSSATQLGF
jgi:tRNA(fMet)-specific endonuclease VapC